MVAHLSITRLVSALMLLDIVLLALVSFSGTRADVVLANLLPGHFGPGMGAQMTGNHLLGALILLLNALAILAAGFALLLGAARAVTAEQPGSGNRQLRSGGMLVRIGAVLLLLALPAVCFTYAKADANGAPLLRDTNGPVANAALTVPGVAIFAAGEVLDAVLLDIPRVYDWRLSPLRPASGQAWLRPFVLASRILAKLIVLALLFTAWFDRKLRASALPVAAAIPAVAVAKEPAPAILPVANDTLPTTEAPAPETQAAPEPPPAEPADPGHDHGSEFALEPVMETPLPSALPQAEAQSEPVRALLLGAPADAAQEQPTEAPREPLLETDAPSQPAEALAVETPQPARPERPRLFLVHPQAEDTSPAIEQAPGNEAEPSQTPPAPAMAAQAIDDQFSDAPLSLHELRNPDEIISPAADNHEIAEEERGSPYKKTALHVLPEFDA